MASTDKDSVVREAVAVFFDAEHLKKTLSALRVSGYSREQLGVLASEHVVEDSLGEFYSRTNNAYDKNESPVTAFVDKEGKAEEDSLGGSLFFVGTSGAVGAVVASSAVLGGSLLAALSGVVAIGVLGALMGKVIHQSEADYLQQQVEEGHLVLFVRLNSADEDDQIKSLLAANGGRDVKIHEIALQR